MLALFDHGSARLSPLTPRRIDLGRGCWVEYQPGFVQGHESLMEHLVHSTPWQQRERWMVDRMVLEPRLTATVPPGGGHAILRQVADQLSDHYAARLRQLTLSYYRDGQDSVAPHGDRGEAAEPGCLTVSVSLGAPRRLVLRPIKGGSSGVFNLGWGDLFVMGADIQKHWQHGVPKCRDAPPRLACLFWLSPVSPA